MNAPLQAPYPWFGGKARVAAEVWARFGDVPNYVEPFFGSGAVLLSRPHTPRVETINDKDQFVSNFWRAVKWAPDDVATHADWPVNEADLSARHYWLITEGRARLEQSLGDPRGYDAEVAGWWLWGINSWIGSGWCAGNGPWQWDGSAWINRQRPHLGAGRGINRQRPHLGDSGQGINRKLPHLSAGQGINRKLPHLSAGRGETIQAWMHALADRLRDVRVCCGDWTRVLGSSPTEKLGLTAVFLDPPYSAEAGRAELYTVEDFSVAHEVRAWAIANGDNPMLRIALCGYESEHDMPASWSAWRWKAKGGYGAQGEGRGRANAARECIWFSPHCIDARQMSLLAGVA